MAGLAKPWETTMPMASQTFPSIIQSSSFGPSPSVDSNRSQGDVPAPPPRTVQPSFQQNPLGMMNSSNYMSPYSMGSFYGQQPFSYYNGGYRPMMFQNSMNYPNGNFSQLALEESRSAFSTIESVIQTFRAISMLLESTFTSVYSSFRAVTDVFDHFSRVRNEIHNIYPLVLLWRFCKFLYHRLLRFFRLRDSTPIGNEENWSMIYQQIQESTGRTRPQSNSSSSFLVAVFFLVSFGTPMLMFKILNSILKKRQAANNWLEKEKASAQVVALHDYAAQNPDELSFRRGETIFLAPISFQPTNGQWFLATIDRVRTGLIPANYVQVQKRSESGSMTLQPKTPQTAEILNQEKSN